MTDRELMQQALEALEYAAERIGCPDDDDAIGVARKALRERLAQPEQDAVLAEREACAKVCDDLKPFGPELALQKATAEDCAAAIRARGQE